MPFQRRSRRILARIALALSFVVLVLSGTGYLVYRHYDGQITRLTGVTTKAADNSPAVNYLITGVDSREGPDADDGGGNAVTTPGERTDTMMIVHIAKKSSKATIISLPRDSRVMIPGFGFNKLNAAVPLGGPALLVKTVQQLSGLHIDHYVQVDFAGFIAMTNAIGGVQICLTQPAVDPDSGIDLSAGDHTIKGITALEYVRQRHGLLGEDLGRIKRQQTFLGAMFRKVTSAGTLLNPIRLTSFVNTVTKSLTVDQSLTTGDLRSLASRLRTLDPAHVQFETVPVLGTPTIDGVSYVELDSSALPSFFGSLDAAAPVHSATPLASAAPVPSASPSVTAADASCGP